MQARQESADRLLADEDIAPFLPLHTSMTALPIPSESSLFEIIQQPNAEITRNVYFDFKLKISASAKQMESAPPTAELIYENHLPVPGGDSIFDGQFAMRGAILVIRARIKDLSKCHRGQRFRIKVSHCGVVACSNPIKGIY